MLVGDDNKRMHTNNGAPEELTELDIFRGWSRSPNLRRSSRVAQSLKDLYRSPNR